MEFRHDEIISRKRKIDEDYDATPSYVIRQQSQYPKIPDHRNQENDPLNRLYNREVIIPEIDEDWYFSYNMEDTVGSLGFYLDPHTSKKTIPSLPELLTGTSPFTRLSSHKKCLLIVFYNQIYKPREIASSGKIVARCTWTSKDDGRVRACRGSVFCDRDNGEISIHERCNHESRRDYIGKELISRRMCIMKLAGNSKKEVDEAITKEKRIFGVGSLIKKASISRLVTRRCGLETSKNLPKNLDFQKLLETFGAISENGEIIWNTEEEEKEQKP